MSPPFWHHFAVSGVETWLWLPPLAACVISFFTSMVGISGAFLLVPFQMSVLGFASPSASATNLVPSNLDIFDNKDKTSTYGAYYVFHQGPWHAEAEVATGLLGRRNASFLAAVGAAARQHLDQKFLGYQVTGAYTTGHHIFRLRCDFMNYNQGDKWYTTYNPYKESAPGVLRADGADYTPKYQEITAGYTYAFNPELIRKANIKVDYIFRSKNFLAPRAGEQTKEQGGDSIVAAFQVWF